MGVGALHRGPRARPRAPLGHRPRHRRRSRGRSGATSSACPPERIQRLGDDNFWRMADTGPCGPSSEIFWDLGPEYGPATGPAANEDRYVEIWNLVFMQFDAKPDGDAGAAADAERRHRRRARAQPRGAPGRRRRSWDIDVFRPLIAAAEQVTGVDVRRLPRRPTRDVSLRILAEHGRTMTFLVADGVVPSNEERGYVLRRIIRRAVRHAFLLGAERARHARARRRDRRRDGRRVPRAREAARARARRRRAARRSASARRSRAALELLDGVLGARRRHRRRRVLPARHARLPDRPHARDRGGARPRRRPRRLRGARWTEQRTRAQEAHKAAGGKADGAPVELYRELLDELGPTDFTGRQEYETVGAKVRALVGGGERLGAGRRRHAVDVVLDRTPFYAESGGQVGDTGMIETADRRARARRRHAVRPARVWCCTAATVEEGTIAEGDEVDRRASTAPAATRIRRNHTATHVLHWALREVLGTHVKQAGSLVGARSPALRLQPPRGASPASSSTHRGARQRARSSPTRRCATTRPPRSTPRASARSRSSATSTATSCACSRRGSTRSSCAAARTCTRSASSARSRS